MHPWIARAALAPMLAAATLMSGCFLDDDDEDTTPVALNIVQTAQADPNLSLLVEAVVAADLATTLASDTPRPFLRPPTPRSLRCSPSWASPRKRCSPTRHC